MFEYLMPVLFSKIYEGTLLFDSCFAALDAHIAYENDKHIPWGVSESGYFAFDASQNYQYRAFGVPDLGYQTRPARRPGGYPLRLPARVVYATAGGAEQFGAPARPEHARSFWPVRGDRLHPGAPACRPETRHCKIVYGAPSRDDLAGCHAMRYCKM